MCVLSENAKEIVDEWGRVLLSPDDVLELFYAGADCGEIWVKPKDKIDEYNKWCKLFDKTTSVLTLSPDKPELSADEFHYKRSQQWFISDEFSNIDVRATLLDRCITIEEKKRVEMELLMFEKRELFPLLKLMFALIDYFRKENIVWGVGRGSSCASYCLYLIGVHKVDALKYNLDIGEFLK